MSRSTKRKRDDDLPKINSLQLLYSRTPVIDGGGIRLFRLHGGKWNEGLEGNLEIHDGREAYEALSYTWGHPFLEHIPHAQLDEEQPSVRIFSENKGHNFPITRNLASALKHLRHTEDNRLLWIDALCINQDSLAEKSAQVPRMANIFSKASNVCVWLGEERQNSSLALRFIKRILNLDDFDRLVLDESTDEEWAAVFDLMRRSWFSRRWVVQEIALAKQATLHCGTETVPWREFADAVALFVSRHQDLKKLFKLSKKFDHHPDYLGDITALGANRLCSASSNLFRQADEGAARSRLLSLEALVSILSAFESTNPHDTIYAVLSLAEDTRSSVTTSTRVPPTPTVRTPSLFSQESEGFFRRPIQRQRRSTIDVGPDEAQQQHSPNSGTNNVDTGTVDFKSAEDREVATKVVKQLERTFADRTYNVNYEKTFYEVCKDFLTFTFKRSRSLDIICRPWAPQPAAEGLPSWIPTLEGAAFKANSRGIYSRVSADPLVGMPDRQRTYNAAGKFPANWVFGDDMATKSLLVDGFVLDDIATQQLPAQEGIVPFSWLEAAKWKNAQGPVPGRFWRTLVAGRASFYPDQFSAARRTPITDASVIDRSPEGLNPPSYYRRACEYAYGLRPEGGPLNTQNLIISNCPEIVAEFLRRVQCVVWMRTLISTARGKYIGLAPTSARVGDLVCILFGCSVPVVLRRVERSKTTGAHHYLFIGEAYLHGFMDGEAYKVRQSSDQNGTTRFELR